MIDPTHNGELYRFSDELDAFLKNRFNYKRDVCRPNRNGTIDTSFRKKVSIYLRYKPLFSYPTNTLVIASIEFGEPRKGHGEALLRFFADIADQYGIENITIEQLTTDGVRSFAERYGFKRTTSDFNDIRTISVKALKASLSESRGHR